MSQTEKIDDLCIFYLCMAVDIFCTLPQISRFPIFVHVLEIGGKPTNKEYSPFSKSKVRTVGQKQEQKLETSA